MSDTIYKRKYPRLYVEVPATIASIERGDGLCALMTRQLGKGGCMVMGNEYLGAGQIILLNLTLGDHTITATAQVLYESEDNGMILSGTRFIKIGEEDAKVLDEFLKETVEQGEVGMCARSD